MRRTHGRKRPPIRVDEDIQVFKKDHHHHHIPDKSPGYTNAFLDLNRFPYLLGEYLDRRQFHQIDRSLIKSHLFVDEKESMRAIVDISIDDIGKRASDGLPNIVGNNTKNIGLLKMITRHSDRLNHRLDVIRRGIIVRVNYRLENQRTKHVIRSTSEDLRIRDRNYFVDINPRDINDNAIIVNFMDSIVSSVNQFTHGTDRMLIRITSIQMFYECMRREGPRQSAGNSAMWLSDIDDFDDDIHPYYHHQKYQNKHAIGIPGVCNCDDFYGSDKANFMHPPSWIMFNRFYRFDNQAKDIILHHQELNDPKNRIYLIPCGTAHVNRMFMINPGHRIVFKISIWKNDVTAVNNTQRVAQALGAQFLDHTYKPRHKHSVNIDIDTLIRLLLDKKDSQKIPYDKVMKLIESMKALRGKGKHKEDPDDPDDPPEDEPCCEDYPNCDCGDEEEDETNSCGCGCDDINPLSEGQILDILSDIGII